MGRLSRLLDWVRRCPLLLFLPIQAALLFHNLELLPVWTDEQSTLVVAPQPLPRVTEFAAGDIHPPLYFFLLHFWIQLPLPGSPAARMRALSALLALLATLVIDRLWLARLRTGTRLWFLALWTFSPCLLLYARMARSYSMQLLVACLALRAAWRFVEAPRDWRRLLLFSAGVALLLYVHYLPGGAVLLAVTGVLGAGLIRKRDAALLPPLVLSNLLVALAYLPWLLVLGQALGRWIEPRVVYRLVPNFLLDSAVKLVYWFVSFSFGESLPLWGVAVGLAVTPLLLRCLWRGARPGPEWLVLILLAGIAGYIGVDRWVSFPFVPARLLFLLPFYLLLLLRGRERSPKLGAVVCGALLLVELGALHSYFRKADFMNKGYAAPFDEMAGLVRRGLSRENALIILDTHNTDSFSLADRLDGAAPIVVVWSQADLRAVEELASKGAAERIWYLRNTHDTSPAGLSRRLEEQLGRCYRIRKHLFQPYSPVERLVIRLVGWPERPTHFYQVLEMHRGPQCAANGPGQTRSW